METRIRVAIVLAGLPAPQLQVPVGPYRLDMAYPERKLGVEHDGREHLEERRALRDLDRQAYFTARGVAADLAVPEARGAPRAALIPGRCGGHDRVESAHS